jgi:hypothetical protein
MPRVDEVRPKIWIDVIDLYDDGDYSAIWGRREEADKRSLGVRWNGDDKYVGYPNQGANPVWYSEPDFLQYTILVALLAKVKASTAFSRQGEFIDNIVTAIREC